MALTTAQLKALLGRDEILGGDARLELIAGAVSDRIEKEAPDAPDALKDEALVRGVGYFLDVGSGAETRRDSGDVSTVLASPAGWWSRSGAASILRAFVTLRGGGIIG